MRIRAIKTGLTVALTGALAWGFPRTGNANNYVTCNTSLLVLAQIKPAITIQLTDNTINFNANNLPGIYEADKAIGVSVATNYGAWTLSATSAGLTGPNGFISSQRLFASNTQTLVFPKSVAPLNFLSLDAPRLVAQGGPQALLPVQVMRFKVQTLWTDRPGTYSGTVSYTYLANP